MANINVVLALSALVTTFVALIFTIVALSTEYWLVTDIQVCIYMYFVHQFINHMKIQIIVMVVKIFYGT